MSQAALPGFGRRRVRVLSYGGGLDSFAMLVDAIARGDLPDLVVGDGWRVSRFPLVERGICRCRAETLVRAAGHPVPVKSACVFCPFGTRGDFARLRSEDPATFARLEELERSSKLTRSGARMTFGGDTRSLDEWTTGRKAYLPLVRTCAVCGASKTKPLAPSERPPVTWETWQTSRRSADGTYEGVPHAVRTLRGVTRHGSRVTVTVRDGDTRAYRRSKSATVRLDDREVAWHSALEGRWGDLGEWGKREAEARAQQEQPAV